METASKMGPADMNESFELIVSETERLENGKYPGLKYEERMFEKFVKYKDVPVQLTATGDYWRERSLPV
jgi:hypothetical protein